MEDYSEESKHIQMLAEPLIRIEDVKATIKMKEKKYDFGILGEAKEAWRKRLSRSFEKDSEGFAFFSMRGGMLESELN
jgi:hypothetical protein